MRPGGWTASSGWRSIGRIACRAIYLRVSHVERTSTWLPIQVICEQCGKIGTTYATDWNGETVAYKCMPDLVSWAHGCGHEGRVSPLGGRAKLPWNLEWAAKWGLLGVTIEGCGKDLATAGGSRDRSDAISREVFEVEPPRNVAYEFLNVGGKKMSTSKGQGAAAHTIAEVLPPEQLRFLFLRPRPSQVIDFDPEGETIPRLFDEFDRIAAATAGREVKGELPADHERLFAYSLLEPSPDVAAAAAAFRPAFAHLALLLQIPGVDIAARMEAEKGAPLTELEAAVLAERTSSARAWLDSYAPERARLVVRHDAVPEEVAALDAGQRAYLAALAAAAAAEKPGSGDAWQASDLPRGRRDGAAVRARLRAPCTRRSSAEPTARVPAGCWPASSRRSSWSGCAAAAVACRVARPRSAGHVRAGRLRPRGRFPIVYASAGRCAGRRFRARAGQGARKRDAWSSASHRPLAP